MVQITAGGVSFPLLAPSGSGTAPSYSFSGNPGYGFYLGATSGRPQVAQASASSSIQLGADLGLASGSWLRWAAGNNADTSTFDLNLARDGAGALGQRNTTNAQTFNIYNTFTDASNYERGFARWTSNVFEIGNEANGTGSGRLTRIIAPAGQNVYFRTGTTDRWAVDNNGHFTAILDNAYDIGASLATRPRNLFLAGGITTGSATLHTTTTALTNGAAAQVGTLTNAPAAGNPTKWVPINDNGTTRYIPCW